MADITKNPMNRKEALKRTAWLLGGVVSAPTILGFLNGCSAQPGPWNVTNFDAEQAEVVSSVADIIIPTTDTAGAKEVGVPAYIEDMVFNMWDTEGQKSFMANLSDFQSRAQKELGKAFHEASAAEKQVFVEAEHDRVFGGNVDWNAPRPFIWQMKELTISGYFTTEVGMTQVLQYKQVPGRYEACLPFEEAGGRVWAS